MCIIQSPKRHRFPVSIISHAVGTVKLSKIVSKRAIFLDFRQQEVFEWLRPKWI
ncbi:hypothetical protein [Candidatus Tisiphia endosymbiont of Neophilaenus lineatus]|uniref:hypothetical protein n=1 Tax=Candidatus Tisiphia endosymbiont of Neophilaenus lineatus TaxID=3139336 RepID=UPI0035CB6F78